MYFSFDVQDNRVNIQYSPRIMRAQEVVQEVLAPQEHASGKKKLKRNSARSLKSIRKKPQEVTSPTANRK